MDISNKFFLYGDFRNRLTPEASIKFDAFIKDSNKLELYNHQGLIESYSEILNHPKNMNITHTLDTIINFANGPKGGTSKFANDITRQNKFIVRHSEIEDYAGFLYEPQSVSGQGDIDVSYKLVDGYWELWQFKNLTNKSNLKSIFGKGHQKGVSQLKKAKINAQVKSLNIVYDLGTAPGSLLLDLISSGFIGIVPETFKTNFAEEYPIRWVVFHHLLRELKERAPLIQDRKTMDSRLQGIKRLVELLIKLALINTTEYNKLDALIKNYETRATNSIFIKLCELASEIGQQKFSDIQSPWMPALLTFFAGFPVDRAIKLIPYPSDNAAKEFLKETAVYVFQILKRRKESLIFIFQNFDAKTISEILFSRILSLYCENTKLSMAKLVSNSEKLQEDLIKLCMFPTDFQFGFPKKRSVNFDFLAFNPENRQKAYQITQGVKRAIENGVSYHFLPPLGDGLIHLSTQNLEMLQEVASLMLKKITEHSEVVKT